MRRRIVQVKFMGRDLLGYAIPLVSHYIIRGDTKRNEKIGKND